MREEIIGVSGAADERGKIWSLAFTAMLLTFQIFRVLLYIEYIIQANLKHLL